jgi:hypothetical protein
MQISITPLFMCHLTMPYPLRRFLGSSLCAALLLGAAAPLLHATVDDSVSFAYEAALPYYKQGYSIRKDAWGGDLAVHEKKAVSIQLFKGNTYWFLMATEVKGATLSVHLYDDKGNLVDGESWQKGRFAGARVNPRATGTYFAIVQILKSSEDRTTWALVYGYK